MVLALAIAFLTVPFLTLAPAYADDAATTTGEVTATEVVDPPPAPPEEEPPAQEPAAEEPAPTEPEPAAQEPPAPEQAAPEEPASTEDTSSEGTSTKGSGKTAQRLSAAPALAPLPDPDCTVTGFTQNTAEGGGGTWINGALNQNNSNYAEGDLVPQKIDLKGLVPGEYTIAFTFDRTKNDLYAYDYVTGLYINGSTGATASWTSPTNPGDFDGPAPVGAATGTTTVSVTITFTITDANDGTAVIGWDGHIASELDYGPDSGAGTINGAPYHFSLVSTGGDFGCDTGSRDNQLMADAVDAGEITIVKNAVPDDAQDFHFTLDAPNSLHAAFDLDDDGDATLPSSVTYRVPPGTTTAAEVNIPDGWTLTDITCSKAGTETANSVSVTLADNEAVTCTFTNSRTSTLEVDKMWVINGGTPVAEGSEPAHLGLGAQLTVDGNNEPWNTALDGYLQGTTVTLNESVTFGNDLCDWAGTTHGSVTEVNGATPADGTLPHDVALGGGANHATITNEVTCDGALVLRKVVDNTNGGTAVPGDFTLVASPAGGGADLTTQGSLAGHSLTVTAGATYDLSETGSPVDSPLPAGYTLAGIDCGAGEVTSVQVPAGDTVTCTFTNEDSPGSLTLVKVVDPNGTGDTTGAGAWTLTADPDFEGQATISGTTGVSGPTKAGTYDLSETGPATYTQGTWSCLEGNTPVTVTDSSVTLEMGQDVTCTITNTAIPPHLTLVKIVDPGDTGDLTDATAFTLTATPDGIVGQDPLTGPGPIVEDDVMVGSYDLSESGPVGYAPHEDGWQCIDSSQAAVPVVDGAVTLGVADDVTCTIVNVAVPATVEVDKYWSVNGGEPMLDGTEPADLELDAQLLVNGNEHDWDTVIGGFLRGAPLTLDEDVTVGNEHCRATGARLVESHGSEANEALPYDDTVLGGTNHYTILNTVECASELTLVKVVDPGDTGDETGPEAFTLTADPTLEGEPTLSGAGGASSAVTEGDYVLSETGPTTYAADLAGWSCVIGDDPVAVTDSTVTVPLATSVTCTIVNHAIPSEWSVAKTSDPPSGSTVQPGEQIDYTVTVSKVGNGVPVEDFDVTDTLTGVEDGWVSGLDAGATIENGVITWHIDELGDTPLTLTYTVTVGADAWNSEIDNVVTPGPVPCLDVDGQDCDHTEHFTPHYTLDKAVALLEEPGDGDDLAEPGERLEYTLTIANDTEHAVVDTVITDDLSDVLDDASIVSLGDGLSLDGTELSWTVENLAAGDSLEVSYVVEIDDGAFGVTLRNIATPVPDDGGECIPPGDVPGGTDDNDECETTTETPPVTTLVVEKRDAETGDVLSGAGFTLFLDANNTGEGSCEFATPPVVDGADTPVGPEEFTDATGQVRFEELQKGCYILQESTTPDGFEELDPKPTMGIDLTGDLFVPGSETAPVVFTNVAEGNIQVVAKQQFELIGGAWVPSDGVVDYGDQVKYKVQIAVTGPKKFHDITVTDFVPGNSPEDTTSTLVGTLVPDSAVCVGTLACTVSVNEETQEVTWDIGDVDPEIGETLSTTAEMVVNFPELDVDRIPEPGETVNDALWNVGYLHYGVLTGVPVAARGGARVAMAMAAAVDPGVEMSSLRSNEVVVTASVTADEAAPPVVVPPKKGPLPQTGAPAGILPLGLAAIILIGAGLGLTRRKEE